MSDQQLMEFFMNNEDLFVNNNIVLFAVKWIGWLITKGLVKIADMCESLYDISFGMVDFTNWSTINNFVEQFKPLFVALFAVSLVALGLILIFAHEKKPKIIINLCIAILCVTSSTVVFQQLNEITKDLKAGIENVATVEGEYDGVYDIVSDNIVDIVYLDQKIGMENINFDANEKELPHPDINENNFSYISYTEVLNPKSDFYEWQDEGNAQDILSNKLILVDWDSADYGQQKITEVYNGFGWNSSDDADFGNEFYYRYQFNFFTAILQLLAVILLYVAMSYKCVRIAFELVVARLFAYLYSAEMSGGQKIAKILVFIRDSYILLLVTTLCIRIFYMLNAFISESIDNTFVKGIFILFAAFAVIDGPNLVEKLLGMDAGLSSSTARIMAAYGIVRGATGAMKNTAVGGKHLYDKIKEKGQERANRKATEGMATGAVAGAGAKGPVGSNQSGKDDAYMNEQGKGNDPSNTTNKNDSPGEPSADKETSGFQQGDKRHQESYMNEGPAEKEGNDYMNQTQKEQKNQGSFASDNHSYPEEKMDSGAGTKTTVSPSRTQQQQQEKRSDYMKPKTKGSNPRSSYRPQNTKFHSNILKKEGEQNTKDYDELQQNIKKKK